MFTKFEVSIFKDDRHIGSFSSLNAAILIYMKSCCIHYEIILKGIYISNFDSIILNHQDIQHKIIEFNHIEVKNNNTYIYPKQIIIQINPICAWGLADSNKLKIHKKPFSSECNILEIPKVDIISLDIEETALNLLSNKSYTECYYCHKAHKDILTINNVKHDTGNCKIFSNDVV